MTTIGYPLRSVRLRRAAALVKVPRVVIAALLWLVVIEALRGLAAWIVLVLLVGGTVAAIVAEPVVVRVLWWATQPPTTIVVSCEDSQVRVLVTTRPVEAIGQAGRRHLVVPEAWVGRADLPELLVVARRRQLLTAGSADVAYQWFTWPWQVLAAFVGGFARGMARLPLVGLAWRIRLVVAGIAVGQTVAAGQHHATAGIFVAVGLTYLLPWTTGHEGRLIREALASDPRRVPTSAPQRPDPRPQRASVGRRTCARAPRDAQQVCGQRRFAAPAASCGGEGSRGRAHDVRTGRKGLTS